MWAEVVIRCTRRIKFFSSGKARCNLRGDGDAVVAGLWERVERYLRDLRDWARCPVRADAVATASLSGGVVSRPPE